MKVNAKEAILKYLQNKPMPGYLEVSFSFTMFNEVSHPSSQVSRHKNAALGLNRFYRNHFVHLEPRNQKEHTTDNPTLFRTQQKPLVLSLTHTALLLVHIGPIPPASAVCSSCGILCARLPKRLPPAQVKWEETSPPPPPFLFLTRAALLGVATSGLLSPGRSAQRLRLLVGLCMRLRAARAVALVGTGSGVAAACM